MAKIVTAKEVDLAAPKNRLFYGDNLDVLRRKIKDETVDLCYIDPPFNSKRNFALSEARSRRSVLRARRELYQ